MINVGEDSEYNQKVELELGLVKNAREDSEHNQNVDLGLGLVKNAGKIRSIIKR